MRPADGKWVVGQIIGFAPGTFTEPTIGSRFKVIEVRSPSNVDIVCIDPSGSGWLYEGKVYDRQYMVPNQWIIYEDTDDPNGIP